VTLVRTDRWLGGMELPDEAEAQRALLGKYLGAYGPATVADFAYWSGIPLGQVRALPAALGPRLVEVGAGLLLRDDLPLLEAGPKGHVRLLPHFDPLLLGHRDKGHLVDERHYKEVYRDQWWISPVVLVDGVAAGTWSYKAQRRKLEIAVTPFAQLARAVRAGVEREVASLQALGSV
jgi:hypothetical protein